MEILKVKNAMILDIRINEWFKNGLDTAEERFDELEDTSEETFWNIAQRDKEVKNRKKG